MRKRTEERVERKKETLKKPVQRDPTIDEIWGVGGLAEQERMKRPQTRLPEREEVRE